MKQDKTSKILIEDGKNDEEDGASGSTTSRSSVQSKLCKERDNEQCIFCEDNLTLEAAHIYEIRYHNKLPTNEKKNKLRALNLTSINEIYNLITLCKKCHNNFDNHRIGLYPSEDYRVIITEKIRETTISNGLNKYSSIHGKKLKFNIEVPRPPSLLALEFRYRKDEESNFLKKNSNFYCLFCLFLAENKDLYDSHNCQEVKNNVGIDLSGISLK